MNFILKIKFIVLRILRFINPVFQSRADRVLRYLYEDGEEYRKQGDYYETAYALIYAKALDKSLNSVQQIRYYLLDQLEEIFSFYNIKQNFYIYKTKKIDWKMVETHKNMIKIPTEQRRTRNRIDLLKIIAVSFDLI